LVYLKINELRMGKSVKIGVVILVLTFAFGQLGVAQCPMCRMTLESNLQNGGTAGAGINGGIIYLLIMPYIIVGTIAFVWARNNIKRKKERALQEAIG